MGLTKMLFFLVSTSMVVLAASSALPHPGRPAPQERGKLIPLIIKSECMAWSWSSATGWKCTQEINTDPVDLDKFRQDSLAAHNVYRAKHGVPDLKLNNELNALAQEWADYLIANNAFEHRPNTKYGENIFQSGGKAAQDQAQGAVDMWYSEIKDYTLGQSRAREALSQDISPRWFGKAALRLALESVRRAVRWWWWRTTRQPATTSGSTWTTSLLLSRPWVNISTWKHQHSRGSLIYGIGCHGLKNMLNQSAKNFQ